MAYLWQNDIAKYWYLGPSLDVRTFRTTEASVFAHEDHNWQYTHDGRRVEVEICFKAYIHTQPQQDPDTRTLTQQRSSGAGGSAGAAGGPAGASSGTSAASASPAPRSSTGSSHTSGGGAGGGPSDAAAQVDRLTAGDALCISFEPEDEKEGFFYANVTSVDVENDKVTFRGNKTTSGFLPGFVNELSMVGATSYSQALLYHMDFILDRNIRKPHPANRSKTCSGKVP